MRFRVLVLFSVMGLVPSHGAGAEVPQIGPVLPFPHALASPRLQSDSTVTKGPVHRPASGGLGCPTRTIEDPTPETLERVSGEEKGPRIAEPMVFDLIRPLGATRGEGETNILAMIPLREQSRRVNEVADPLGLVRRSPDRGTVEWAPEIEFTVCDGIAVEFEVPIENSRTEAYKAAGQVTFGTAFDHHFIHGAQAIIQYGRDSSIWTTTGLYIAGVRLDKTWSLFGMLGGRAEIIGPVSNKAVELLANATLFADVTDRLVAGVETNFNQVIRGDIEALVMPQLHYEVDRHWMIQAGVGARFTTKFTLPVAGFRIIREFSLELG
jgi:hypothetical protein